LTEQVVNYLSNDVLQSPQTNYGIDRFIAVKKKLIL